MLMTVGNAAIDPSSVRSATIEESTDWLGMPNGYYIQCKMADGSRLRIRDRNGRNFYIPEQAMKELGRIVKAR